MMPPERFDAHIEANSRSRPFNARGSLGKAISSQRGHCGNTSRSLCDGLTKKRRDRVANRRWMGWKVARRNNIPFSNEARFNANAEKSHYTQWVRLIGAVVTGSHRFFGIDLWKDGYMNLTHSHMADLQSTLTDILANQCRREQLRRHATLALRMARRQSETCNSESAP